jgi:hypothetical protein
MLDLFLRAGGGPRSARPRRAGHGGTAAERDPDVGAIVSECTNLPPYSAKIEQALRVPVFDRVSFVAWFHAGLRPE